MSPFVLIVIVSVGSASSVTSVDMPSFEVCQRARAEMIQASRITPHLTAVSPRSFCLDRSEPTAKKDPR